MLDAEIIKYYQGLEEEKQKDVAIIQRLLNEKQALLKKIDALERQLEKTG